MRILKLHIFFLFFSNINLIFLRKRLTLRLNRVLELQDEVLCVAVSPNEKFIVFGLLDNTARVYYVDSLRFFVSLYGHSLPIYSVDISSVVLFLI